MHKMRLGLLTHVEAQFVKSVKRRLMIDDNMVQLYSQYIKDRRIDLDHTAKYAKIISERDFRNFLGFWDAQDEDWHQQRTVSLHPDYQRVTYNLQSDYVISKVAQVDQRNKFFDHGDRQVYHRFK